MAIDNLMAKLDAMVAEKRNTDPVYVLQDVALNLLGRLDAAETPCVWTYCEEDNDWNSGCERCGNEAEE